MLLQEHPGNVSADDEVMREMDVDDDLPAALPQPAGEWECKICVVPWEEICAVSVQMMS